MHDIQRLKYQNSAYATLPNEWQLGVLALELRIREEWENAKKLNDGWGLRVHNSERFRWLLDQVGALVAHLQQIGKLTPRILARLEQLASFLSDLLKNTFRPLPPYRPDEQTDKDYGIEIDLVAFQERYGIRTTRLLDEFKTGVRNAESAENVARRKADTEGRKSEFDQMRLSDAAKRFQLIFSVAASGFTVFWLALQVGRILFGW